MIPQNNIPQLPVLDAGPWISAGRRFNYEHWPERERFVELDDLIAKAKCSAGDSVLDDIHNLACEDFSPEQSAMVLQYAATRSWSDSLRITATAILWERPE